MTSTHIPKGSLVHRLKISMMISDVDLPFLFRTGQKTCSSFPVEYPVFLGNKKRGFQNNPIFRVWIES